MWYWYLLVGIASVTVGIFIGQLLRKRFAEKTIKSAEAEAEKIVNEAKQKAESKKKSQSLKQKKKFSDTKMKMNAN